MDLRNTIRILYLVGDPYGGIRKHVHDLIFNLTNYSQLQVYYAYSIKSCDEIFLREIAKIQNIIKGTLKLLIYKKPHINDFYNILMIFLFIKKNRIDIIHAHGAKAGLYARVISFFTKVKVIYTPHGGVLHDMFNKVEEFLYITVERILYYATDFLIFESSYSYEQYFKKIVSFSQKIPFLINQNAIQLLDLVEIGRRAKTLKYSDNFKIGVFGMLRKIKGQEYALEALKILKNRIKDIELHFYGDGPDLKYLKKLTFEYDILDRVFFHGFVEDIYPHMLVMDLVLIPSLYESFPYVLLEAFSLEKPVIASNIAEISKIIVNNFNGVLVKSQDSREIAIAIERLYYDRDFMKFIGKNGYETLIKNFNIERMLENVRKVYLNIVKQ